MSKKLLVICGPTATGKTALGIKLARKFSGEIVSADSRQVYQGMDIGTGKDLPVDSKLKTQNSKLPRKGRSFDPRGRQLKTQKYQIGYYLLKGIRVWLYDVVEPDYYFSVADYVDCGQIVVENIWRRGRLPIIVGGTGFYIKGLIDGIETVGVEPDWGLRRKLQSYKVPKLQRILERACPERMRGMNESDRRNPRRLIRAIEIALKLKTQNLKRKTQSLRTDTLFIGLKAPLKVLYQRIDQRAQERVGKGAKKEVGELLKKGYSWDLPSMQAMGYEEWKPYFKEEKRNDRRKLGSIRKRVIRRWQLNEHAYARRQMTWFKKALRPFGSAQDKQTQGVWFDITQGGFEQKVVKLVRGWYIKSDGKKN